MGYCVEDLGIAKWLKRRNGNFVVDKKYVDEFLTLYSDQKKEEVAANATTSILRENQLVV
jgi:hypothetical protein